jgi:hypothetical protein
MPAIDRPRRFGPRLEARALSRRRCRDQHTKPLASDPRGFLVAGSNTILKRMEFEFSNDRSEWKRSAPLRLALRADLADLADTVLKGARPCGV